MALTEFYVDPVGGNDSTGDGLADVSAWKTVQKMLNTVTASAGGDRCNVKNTGDDVLGSTLSFASYGVPLETRPLVLQGYSDVKADGGIGGINGGGNQIILSTTADGISIIDMHLHNGGGVGAGILRIDNSLVLLRCEINNTEGWGVRADFGNTIVGCYFHDIGASGILIGAGTIGYNFFQNDGTFDMDECIEANASDGLNIYRNIFSVDGTTNGVDAAEQWKISVSQNTFYSTGTGIGIKVQDDNGHAQQGFVNNIIEGWATGINHQNTTNAEGPTYIFGNAFFDNDTDEDGDIILLDNEFLSETPLAKSGANTYANRRTFFRPLDVGNVLSPIGGMGGAKGAI